jgi:hypothetical protein
MTRTQTSIQACVPRRTEARLAAVTARSIAAFTAQRCRGAAPDEEWLLATPLRIPPIPTGAPNRPLILGVAALATANAAVGLALQLVTASGEAGTVDLALATAHRMASAAQEGIDALESRRASGGRQHLAHATAQATHAAADALAAFALTVHTTAVGRPPRPEYEFPRALGRAVDALEMRLYGRDQATPERGHDRASIVAAEAACAAAMRAVQVCAMHSPRLGACSATHRVVRAACLASTFVGWAALEA